MSVKRIFIVHRWGGDSSKDWYEWITPILENKGFHVNVLNMPDTNTPTIANWVGKLNDTLTDPDNSTYIISHSVGCQAVLRYLENIGKQGKKIGGALFVAGWFHVDVDKKWESIIPWIETPINFNDVKETTSNFRTLLSDNDQFTSDFNKNSKEWKENIGSTVVIENNGKHFNESQENAVLREILLLVDKS